MKTSLFTVILFLTFSVCGQNNLINFKDSLSVKSNFFAVDNFENIYTANGDVINKYNKNLDSLFSTSLKTIFPSSIEASKTFRVLLFDKERATIAFYDNTLTVINEDISLATLDIIQACLVAESFNGNSIWILDEGNMQLLKIDNKLNILLRVENLNHLFKNNIQATQMFEYNDILTIHFKNSGVATFDIFGSLLNFYPIDSDWIMMRYNRLYSIKNDVLSIYELPLMDKVGSQKLNTKNIKQFHFTKNKILFQTPTAIHIYEINTKLNE